ncbi:MAG: hypothetical protein DWQ47_03705 [Acidobacteria bacterium]|nr:MAG: hypothetical protein DWQ32_07255 [Acidobacteriota bacterium]REK01502.1 MAG: hypothetical protein DWQ38_03690 [Acidobacteriota bacterium]REK14458.1 MAG: hypothetical protein DWQ43_12945 [Acidobacteriota bacterium]REK45173.1 MAG: hypothetical protein DWQ47_03705 [Acidobacteriota bacterium]
MIRTATAFIVLLLPVMVLAQPDKAPAKPFMWQEVDTPSRDLFYGPGGKEMVPDVSKVKVIEKETGGSSLKYRITDANGREWVAKIDKESQPETVAVRLLYGLGYTTEINYLVPEITIPGKGTYQNVRLEARPEAVDRGDRWDWEENPFAGTPELGGLKIMMVMLGNWDTKNGNNIILHKNGVAHYAVSDLGAGMGSLGSNSLPIIWRIGRSVNDPEDYAESTFIKEVEDGMIEFDFGGFNHDTFKEAPVEHGRWLANRLLKLTDKQIDDALRAANYEASDASILKTAIKQRIQELDRHTR